MIQPKTFAAGWRVIGGQRIYCRSAWEANYARYLELLRDMRQIRSWQHEPQTFWFPEIKRGVCSYLPDFRVEEMNGRIDYHEVKGFMDPKSRTKIKRMAKYHPTIKLIVVDAKCYRSIAKQVSRIIPGWETQR